MYPLTHSARLMPQLVMGQMAALIGRSSGEPAEHIGTH